ncbi:MAG: hypothetical protein COW62_10575 [Zetaproteobacteria bacterium CG17_big_fil_post_rev_8_21_14_2_50_50_13]|nr:MAG: hypothetical protein COW62_10575 [Zetaproteobacteria bacterium CG17_big_fil_post_rev_8_21_14_2_50_50_13]PIY56562.1 MAG: hypothetical protein COZ00_03565 [Zetaproteobacteria bacterium CG_4_10_14_0_8_um_filter_49_80]
MNRLCTKVEASKGHHNMNVVKLPALKIEKHRKNDLRCKNIMAKQKLKPSFPRISHCRINMSQTFASGSYMKNDLVLSVNLFSMNGRS